MFKASLGNAKVMRDPLNNPPSLHRQFYNWKVHHSAANHLVCLDLSDFAGSAWSARSTSKFSDTALATLQVGI